MSNDEDYSVTTIPLARVRITRKGKHFMFEAWPFQPEDPNGSSVAYYRFGTIPKEE